RRDTKRLCQSSSARAPGRAIDRAARRPAQLDQRALQQVDEHDEVDEDGDRVPGGETVLRDEDTDAADLDAEQPCRAQPQPASRGARGTREPLSSGRVEGHDPDHDDERDRHARDAEPAVEADRADDEGERDGRREEHSCNAISIHGGGFQQTCRRAARAGPIWRPYTGVDPDRAASRGNLTDRQISWEPSFPQVWGRPVDFEYTDEQK